MSKFNPERLSVEYRDGITAIAPVVYRKHTLTHSDFSGQLFLTIGMDFAWDKINQEMRDEVLGEWKVKGDSVYYNVYVNLNKEEQERATAIAREEVFKRELPLALTAIRYGDQAVFQQYLQLNHAIIIVNFVSTYPELNKQENWGTFGRFIM